MVIVLDASVPDGRMIPVTHFSGCFLDVNFPFIRDEYVMEQRAMQHVALPQGLTHFCLFSLSLLEARSSLESKKSGK